MGFSPTLGYYPGVEHGQRRILPVALRKCLVLRSVESTGDVFANSVFFLGVYSSRMVSDMNQGCGETHQNGQVHHFEPN